MKLQKALFSFIASAGLTVTGGIIVLVSPILALGAESSQLVSESEFFSDIPEFSTTTRLPQSKSETPAAITIIDKELMRASGVRYIQDIFRLVPGFQVAYSTSERAIVTYHGLGDITARRMLVLIDGRSAYSAAISNVSWFNLGISISDIERIEVIRGPNTVTYGDNAFFATINIITQYADQSKGFTAKITAGNHDILDGMLRYATDFKGGAARVTANYLSDDGYTDKNDDIQSGFLNARIDLQPSKKDDLLLQFSVGQNDHDIGSESSTLSPPATRNRENRNAQIRWQHFYSTQNELAMQFYYNQLVTDLDYTTQPFRAGPLGVIQVPVSGDATDERFDFEVTYKSQLLDSLRTVLGAGVREDRVESEAFFNSNAAFTNQSTRLFGNVDWRARHDTILNAGLLWEDNEITGDDLSPRLALNYHINNQNTLRTSWSRAYRIPSLGEEYADKRFSYSEFLLNHEIANQYELNNETMDSFEIGYLGRFPDQNSTLEVRIYRDKIYDFITTVLVPASDLRDGEAIAYRNEGDITIDGLEFEVTYQVMKSTRILFNTAFMKPTAQNFSSDSVYTASQIEDSVPDYSGSLFILQNITENWNASLGYYFVDDMLWVRQSTNNNKPPVSDYGRLDLRVARNIRFNGSTGEVSFVAQNVGSDYEDHSVNRLFDTRYFVNFEVNFR